MYAAKGVDTGVRKVPATGLPLLLGEGHRSDCFPARTPQEDAKNAGKISSRMIGHPQMRS